MEIIQNGGKLKVFENTEKNKKYDLKTIRSKYVRLLVQSVVVYFIKKHKIFCKNCR